MGQNYIDQLIINSPYEEPKFYWHYDRENRQFEKKAGRRPAGYIISSQNSQGFDDPGTFFEISLVKKIRECVNAWRDRGYPGVSGITRRLLEFWTDTEEEANRHFFFCQIEAIETLIWLTEGPETDKIGIEILGDGSEFPRLCAKMATGTGKTVVMAMTIAWHILNKVSNPKDARFSKNIFIVTPGLTVKNRLSVLKPSNPENFYKTFNIVPPYWFDKLRQGKVLIRNRHALNFDDKSKKSGKHRVDKRGPKSDAAYVRKVLGDLCNSRNILVINDEAHHAWRVPVSMRSGGIDKKDIEEATQWINGLDRIARVQKINICYDFSATPFIPSKYSHEESLFSWIVSDFGLNDAIESGLVKTPRIVIRDDAIPDAQNYRSRLYHIYNDPDVKDDLNREAKPEDPLPDLVINGYYLLGYDWREVKKSWKNQGALTPPVMITVANRSATAARIKYAFDHERIKIHELCDPERTLHIDSKALQAAESQEHENEYIEGERKKSDLLRVQVNTIGKVGEPGELIQNVISVGMLTEGWDAKTVTHIMGLRAFTSQLLCEQVVGRGLRRTSYEINPDTGFFDPEYVNIFGVPFSFIPHEGSSESESHFSLPSPKTAIHPVQEKEQFAISWPNIVRIDRVYETKLSLNLNDLPQLELSASQTARFAELAPVVDGKPDISKIEEIDLENLAREFRTQRIVFEVSRDVYEQMQNTWRGDKFNLIRQIVVLIEKTINSDVIKITPDYFNNDELKRRLLITLNMTKIVQHIKDAIQTANTRVLEPIFNSEKPILSTGEMQTWFTGRPCEIANHCHINYCVYDSSWEASEAFVLDRNPHVFSWVKNDHLGFEIFYIYRGIVKKYRPDFLIKFSSGRMLVLEVKGREGEEEEIKHRALSEWVRAVNSHGGFGCWRWAVSRNPGDINDILLTDGEFEVTAWHNGSGTFGFRVGKNELQGYDYRYCHFLDIEPRGKKQKEVRWRFYGDENPVTLNITGSFWNGCPELRGLPIKEWLCKHQYVKDGNPHWPEGGVTFKVKQNPDGSISMLDTGNEID